MLETMLKLLTTAPYSNVFMLFVWHYSLVPYEAVIVDRQCNFSMQHKRNRLTYCLSCFCYAYVHGFTVRICCLAIAEPHLGKCIVRTSFPREENSGFSLTVCVVFLVKFVVFCAASGL